MPTYPYPRTPHEKVRRVNSTFPLDDLHQFRIDVKTFTVYIGADPHHLGMGALTDHEEPGVEAAMVDRAEKNLMYLSSIDPQRPILVMLASCGGNWHHGMQLFSAILHCPNPVTVVALNDARSMTSIIPLAADRFLLRPPANYMIHYGTYGFWGTEQEADTEDLERRKMIARMLMLYTARLKSQGQFAADDEVAIKQRLQTLMKDRIDAWFSPQEAVDWGFADGLFDIGDTFASVRATAVNTNRRYLMRAVLEHPLRVRVIIE